MMSLHIEITFNFEDGISTFHLASSIEMERSECYQQAAA